MRVVVIFGSNSGDKYNHIRKAIELLAEKAGKIIKTSSIYETEPWGFQCDDFFLNQIVIYESYLSPEEFLKQCLAVEKKMGRVRTPSTSRYTSRPIDIDILFYESLIMKTPSLTIPHPRLIERNFVLIPLNEILPDFLHPLYHKKTSELLANSPDKSVVKLSKKQ